MRAPDFWGRPGHPLALLLAPLGQVYAGAVHHRLRRRGWRAPVPVVCVGNLVAGGAGKTPVVGELARRLRTQGIDAHVLVRGYGGRFKGPVRVASSHGADDVGDEAVLLRDLAPTWVARNRREGAEAACAGGAQLLIMDDGFQNPALAKDLSLLVVDGDYGFGNGRVIPAGPLREPVAAGLARADAVVVVGEDRAGIAERVRPLPVVHAHLEPGTQIHALAERRVFAFAGIGRPQKFFDTLVRGGCELAGTRTFADHHPYSQAEGKRLIAEAGMLGAVAVTTAKDAVRLPLGIREQVRVLDVSLVIDDEAALEALLARVTGDG